MTQTTPIAKPHFPEVFSNTMREALVNCAHKGYWAFIRNLVPATPSIHLHAGGAYAQAMEEARRAFHEHGKTADEAVDAGYRKLTEAYGDFDFANGFENHNKGLANLQQGYLDYFMEYPLDRDDLKPVIMPNGKAALEFSFTIPTEVAHPVTGQPILYAGKFDMLAELNGTLYVVDDKTTSQLGSQWSQQWDLNSQFTGYCAAARQMGYPVAGAIIRGIGLLKTKITHQQVILSRPEWQIERWWNQIHRDLKLFISMWEADDGTGREFSYALGSACTSYGACAYKRLCESPNPEEWIHPYYTANEYSPLKLVEEH